MTGLRTIAAQLDRTAEATESVLIPTFRRTSSESMFVTPARMFDDKTVLALQGHYLYL